MVSSDIRDILQRLAAAEARIIEIHNCSQEIKADIKDLEEAKADLAGVMESTKLAKDIMDARLASMNEFRGSLRDQQSNFVGRTEAMTRWQGYDEDIRTLRESRAELQGKANQSQVLIAEIIAVVGTVISVITLFIQFG